MMYTCTSSKGVGKEYITCVIYMYMYMYRYRHMHMYIPV